METIKLIIICDKAFVGAVLPYHLFINGKEMGKIKKGKNTSYELPYAQSTLKVSIPRTSLIHKVEKEVVLFPQFCNKGIINCTIVSKLNLLGFISLGIVQPHYVISLHIEYL